MATEETNKPAAGAPESNVGNGDMAHLIGNMGILIDSTIETVQGMLSNVSSATGQIVEGVTATVNSDTVKGIISNVSTATNQLIEGVTTTVNSDAVKGILNNVNSVSGQIIEGVTSTLNSEQIQNSFNELGKFWAGMISNLNETVSTGQVKNLFDNVSAGINQLAGGIFQQGMPPMFMGSGSGSEDKKKIVQQIPVTLTASKPAAPAPENKPEA
ncbi:MAG: chlorosome envelope protein H [Chlorobaculum sp.]|nr:chlorosome envelope protein H [Chlorobaculum sp.]